MQYCLNMIQVQKITNIIKLQDTESIKRIQRQSIQRCRIFCRLGILLSKTYISFWIRKYEIMNFIIINFTSNVNSFKKMSQSPIKSKAFQSPTKISGSRLQQEPQFYVKKINRLENDLNVIQDELSSTRIKLRKAQQYQLKYNAIAKENRQRIAQNNKFQKQIEKLRAELQRLRLVEQLYEAKKIEQIRESKRLDPEFIRSNIGEVQPGTRRSPLRNKQNYEQQYQRQLQSIRRQNIHKQERYLTEIRQLKRLLQQKDKIEGIFTVKVDRLKTQKDKQIKRLTQIIQKRSKDVHDTSKQKNQEFQKLKQKYEKLLNLEIGYIKDNLQDQNSIFTVEINGLKEIIHSKNLQIQEMINKMAKLKELHEQEKIDLLKQMKLHEENIYKIQRENELEIINIKERLSSIHSVQIKSLQAQHNYHLNILKEEKHQLEKLIKEKQEHLHHELKEIEKFKIDMKEKLRLQECQIIGLRQKSREIELLNAKQSMRLKEAFVKIESQKQTNAISYQQSICFLDQQIKRLVTSLQIKNTEIKNLQQDIATIKKQSAQNEKESEESWKNERKERQIERQKWRKDTQRIEQQWKSRQKEWKNKERDLQKQHQKMDIEIARNKVILEELEKDNQRLNQYIKQLDQSLKKEIKKNQMSSFELGSLRRELTSQFDKNQAQGQTIKRNELDHVSKKLELEIDKLKIQNQKLERDLLNKTLAFQNLQNEYKKLDSNQRNLQRINKQKLLEYQKRMATLNSQILLTQNLYQNFMESKARIKKDN